MDPRPSDIESPDSSAAHLAMQEVLRAPDTLATALQDAAAAGGSKWRLARFVARAIHFFAHCQVAWNAAVARALEQTVRAVDARDRWVERVVARLRAAEERVRQLETEIRAAREAEEDARRKIALLGLRLRDLDERQQEMARRLGGEGR